MLGLKTQCVHPTSQKPYILHASGGTNKSIENFQVSLTPVAVVFGCAGERTRTTYAAVS